MIDPSVLGKSIWNLMKEIPEWAVRLILASLVVLAAVLLLGLASVLQELGLPSAALCVLELSYSVSKEVSKALTLAHLRLARANRRAERGTLLAAIHDLDKGLSRLDYVLKQRPDQLELPSILKDCLSLRLDLSERVGDWPGTVAVADRLDGMPGVSAERIALSRARAKFEMGNPDEAMTTLRAARAKSRSREIDLQLYEWLFEKTRSEYRAQSWNTLLPDLAELVELAPDDKKCFCSTALAEVRSLTGDREGAAAELRQALKLYPNEPQLKTSLQKIREKDMTIAWERKDWTAVVRGYTELIDLADPEHRERLSLLFLDRSTGRRLLQDYRGAVADAYESLRTGQAQSRAYVARALAKCGLGDFSGAIEDLDDAVLGSDQESLASVLRTRASVYEEVGKDLLVIRDYERLIDELFSDARQDIVKLVRVYIKLERYGQAIGRIDRLAVKSSPEDAQLFELRGDAHRGQGQWEQAIDDYRTAQNLDPALINAVWFRGLCLLEESNTPGISESTRHASLTAAVECFRQVTSTLPDFVAVHYSLARALLELGDSADSNRAVARARELTGKQTTGTPSPSNLVFELWPLLMSPDAPELSAEFKKLVQENPNDAHANFGTAWTALRGNETLKAITHFTRVIENKELENEPLFALAYAYRGLARAMDGDWTGAILDGEAALSKDRHLAQAWFDVAIGKYRQQQWKEAVPYFERAVECDPVYVDARRYLLWTRTQLQEYHNVIVDAQKALKAGIHDPLVRVLMANALFGLGKRDECVKECSDALALEPRFWMAWFVRGRAQQEKILAQQDLEKALSFAEQPDERARIHLAIGVLRRQERRFDEAVQAYTEALRDDENLRDAVFERGWSSLEKGDSDKAKEDFTRLTKDNAFAAFGHCGLAELERVQGRLEEALGEANTALAINPDLGLAFGLRGSIRHDRRDLDLAVGDLSRAIERDATNAYFYFLRGECLRQKEQWDPAIVDLTRATELEPKSAPYFNDRGLCYGALQNWERAIADFAQARKLDPSQHVYPGNLAWANDRLGQWEKALEFDNQALLINPKATGSWQRKGYVLIYLDRVSEARECFDKLIELSPRDGYSSRAFLRGVTGDFPAALDDLSKARELNPNSVSELINSAWACNGVGRWAEAIKWATEALGLDPNCQMAHKNRAQARLRLGDLAGAHEDLLEEVANCIGKLGSLRPQRSPSSVFGWTLSLKDWQLQLQEKRSAVALLGTGVARWNSGDVREALKDLEDALSIDSCLIAAHLLSAVALLELSEIGRAESAIEMLDLQKAERPSARELLQRVQQEVRSQKQAVSGGIFENLRNPT